MSCGVSRRYGSDPTLLWLWQRPVAVALIWPLAWEPTHATGAALKSKIIILLINKIYFFFRFWYILKPEYCMHFDHATDWIIEISQWFLFLFFKWFWHWACLCCPLLQYPLWRVYVALCCSELLRPICLPADYENHAVILGSFHSTLVSTWGGQGKGQKPWPTESCATPCKLNNLSVANAHIFKIREGDMCLSHFFFQKY